MNKNELALNNAEITPEKKIRGKGRPFEKGNKASHGRPKGSPNEVTKFKEAIELFEKEQKKSIYDLMLKKSLTNPQILIAIFKALIPQQTESSIKVEPAYSPYKDMSDEELLEQTYAVLKRTGGMKQLKKLEEEELKA